MKATGDKSRVFVLLGIFLAAAGLVWATGTYQGGSGTWEDPYQIATAWQLIDLGRHVEDYDKCFVLVANIDLGINAFGGKIFRQAVISPDETDSATTGYAGVPFSGVFDGQGYIIKNLTFEYPNTDYIGLFGMIDTFGTVANVQLENCTIDCHSSFCSYAGSLVGSNLGFLLHCTAGVNFSNAANYVGGLVGWNEGEIADCHAAGTIQGSENTGGLVGYDKGGLIQRCSSSCAVLSYQYLGGLVGGTEGSSLIIYCYANGPVQGADYVGGLVGKSVDSIISQSYATGSAIAVVGEGHAAGLVYDATGTTIESCYSTGFVNATYKKGLVGAGGPTENSFWDIDTSGAVSSNGGTGLHTYGMKDKGTFLNSGWDFETVWTIVEGQTYPYFQWQSSSPVLCQNSQPFPVGDLNSDCVVNLEDFVLFSSHWLEDLRR
jgi:hypothetical protein